MVINHRGKLLVIELTICHETSSSKSRDYKFDKYQDLCNFSVDGNKDLDLILTTCELSTLGFLQFDKEILNRFNIPPFSEQLTSQLINRVIRISFDIYAHRDAVRVLTHNMVIQTI